MPKRGRILQGRTTGTRGINLTYLSQGREPRGLSTETAWNQKGKTTSQTVGKKKARGKRSEWTEGSTKGMQESVYFDPVKKGTTRGKSFGTRGEPFWEDVTHVSGERKWGGGEVKVKEESASKAAAQRGKIPRPARKSDSTKRRGSPQKTSHFFRGRPPGGGDAGPGGPRKRKAVARLY